MKKWSFLLALVVLVGLLTACGEVSNSGKNAEGNAGSAEVAAPSPSLEPAKQDSNARIASLSIHITNNLLALGMKPIGSVIGGDVKDFLPHVKERLEGVEKYGVASDPDMEAVLASKPDVIYLDEALTGEGVAKFEKIAPVVSIDMDEGTWRDHLRAIAVQVGKQAEAETFITGYEAKAEQTSALIHDELGADAKVMAIRMTAKELRVMGMKRPVGPIMFEDLKLKPANGVEKITDEPYAVISQEVLPDFDADAIFVIISKGNEAKANFDELEKNPVWQNLKAVKNNRVYVLDGQKWLDYSSIGHAMALEDAEKLFTR
ncbi:ABC transporter substrate-binding protein [Paenibacillus harenae]|uniref:Iron complex transport system substrate-binding protein n=1 Tax=Paenibacillus harenae TaxID=306543 RepID=A0ABT9U4D1_PAEHA|nr:ABC transporter substrate-binding protein [Paenibacillus harenae]MDQ0114501.1 iron complex transport system substrate-binding protein [Paenibacillus harenae]